MGYTSDRRFTDYVHTNLALDKIYKDLLWNEYAVDEETAKTLDEMNGIDYTFIDVSIGRKITVQERFREVKYRDYNDFTVRYEREHNFHEERRLSEYYKIDADFFVYGIINASKELKERATDFVKYAVIDVKAVKALIDDGHIVIDKNLRSRECEERNGIIYCPINKNWDNSSTFVPIDVTMLLKLFEWCVIAHKGYPNPNNRNKLF